MLALHGAFDLLLEELHGRLVSEEFVCHTNASRSMHLRPLAVAYLG